MSELNVLLLIGPGMEPSELTKIVSSGGTGKLTIFHHHVDVGKQLGREAAATFHKVISHSISSNFHSTELLGYLTNLLQLGGQLELREAVVPSPASPGPLRAVDDIFLSLSLAGFVDVGQSVGPLDPATVSALFGSVPAGVGAATITARKPSWRVGAAAPLKRSKLVPDSAPIAPKKNVWKIAALDNDLQELNEDDLLETEDLKLPSKQADDCEFDGNGKAKACKDCTCGRAEADFEASAPAVPLERKPAATVKSACGSCYLGDAFRCPTCPSLGLPAYKPGDTVKLSLN